MIGDIRIISAVLAHSTGNTASLPETDVLYIQDQLSPSRGQQPDLWDLPAGQEHDDRRFRRCSGTASGCISQTELLSALFNILLQFH